MAEITKPSGVNKIWASTGSKTAPSDAKILQGWIIEKPALELVNYLDNKRDSIIAHINQHGIAVWDAETEYHAGKSYVQNPSTGILYRCKVTHTNQVTTNTTYWEVAFTPKGESYTKAESDAKYAVKSNNLSDLTNKATARTNLSVYSKAEVDALLTDESLINAIIFG